eukprot:9495466-Pyramimonas_sp.AAC.1
MELSAKRDITADQLRDLTHDGGIFNTNIVAGMGEHSCAKLFDLKADVPPADDDDDTGPSLMTPLAGRLRRLRSGRRATKRRPWTISRRSRHSPHQQGASRYH